MIQFRLALALATTLTLSSFLGCSESSQGPSNNKGGAAGEMDGATEGDDGTEPPAMDAGQTEASGGGQAGNGGPAGNGGQAGNSVLDTSAWGPCQMIRVPAGVNGNVALPQGPVVAPKCLPAGSAASRALSLMATSTATKRHKVKVLFYGQSITKGGWVPATQKYLETTFPHADFEFREEAVGGFWGPLLLRTAEHDVIPWYPDLMVYHSYGPVDNIMQLVRRRTTAEIMLQTHHSRVESDSNAAASDRQSFVELPALGRRLGLHIIDIRGPWKAHLADNGLAPQDLLLPQDDVHLNDAGNALYAKITNEQLKHDASVIVDPLRMVTTYEVGKDVTWNGNKLTLKFDGNRVDIQAKAGLVHQANAASVLIDGKRPSQFVGAYAITRPNREVDADWPWKRGSVIRVTMDATLIPQIEEWTMKLTSITQGGDCTFTVTGSVTGADGTGSCGSQFTSISKRMRIAADDYWFGPPQSLKPVPASIPVGSEIKWNVYALHADAYPPAKLDASDATKEYPTTIVQGIANGQHTLELSLTGESTPAIEAIRVYRPPLR